MAHRRPDYRASSAPSMESDRGSDMSDFEGSDAGDYQSGFDRHFFEGVDYEDPARPSRRRPLSPDHEFPTPPQYSGHTSDYDAGIGSYAPSDDESPDYRDRGFWSPLRNRMASGGYDSAAESDDWRYSIGRLSDSDSPPRSRSPPSRRPPRGEPSDDGYSSEGW